MEEEDIDTVSEELFEYEEKETYIPSDLMVIIFSYLSIDDIVLRLSRVCKYWHVCTAHDALWKEKYNIKWKISNGNQEVEERMMKRFIKRYEKYENHSTRKYSTYINSKHAYVGDVLKWKTIFKLRCIGERNFKEGRLSGVTIYEGPSSDTSLVCKFAIDESQTYLLFGGSNNQISLFHFKPNDEKDKKDPPLAKIWKKKSLKHRKLSKPSRILKKNTKRFQSRCSWIFSFSIHGDQIRGIEFIPNDNHKCISVSHDSTIKVLNLENGQTLATYRQKPFSWIRSLSMSKSGTLFIGSYHKLTKLKWKSNKLTRYKQQMIEGHHKAVLAIREDGDFVYSGGENGWLVKSSRNPFVMIYQVKLHHGYINDIAVSSQFVASIGIDNMVYVRNKDDALTEHATISFQDSPIPACALCWSQQYLLVGFTSGHIVFLDAYNDFSEHHSINLSLSIYKLQCIDERFILASAGCSLVLLDFGNYVSNSVSNYLVQSLQDQMKIGQVRETFIVPE